MAKALSFRLGQWIGLSALIGVLAGCGDESGSPTAASGGAGALPPTGGAYPGATGGLGTGGLGTGGLGTGGLGTGGVGAVATGGVGAAVPTGGVGAVATGGVGAVATGGVGAATTGGAVPTGGVGATATGGGGAATGGTAATGGEAPSGGTGTGGAAAVVPTMVSATDWQFAVPSCDMVLDVNPQAGARVASLTVGGTDIIVPYSCATYDGTSACNQSGSTFWTSPQSVWSWPPVVEIDGGAYTASVSDSHLLLSGSINADLGAGVDKDIAVDAGSCTIVLLYTIKTNQALSAAPWEITRVPRGGLAVFPAGSSMVNSSELTVSETDGHVWLDDSTQTDVVSEGPKIVADGSGGWLAYALNGYLFIKIFADVPAGDLAPDEGDVEIYPGSGYLEIEPQGPYGAIAANASVDWTVRWRVVAIPTTVTVAVGSTTLVEFAQQQAAL